MAELDKIVHERARLLILTYLVGADKKEVSFNELKEELDFTPGNLSIQLKKLVGAKYIKMKKTFKDNKPHTTVSVTTNGAEALSTYVAEMEDIIRVLKSQP